MHELGGEREGSDLRIGIYFIEETTAVILIKYASEAPWLFLERLHILDLHNEHIARLCALDLKGTGQVVDLCEVDILHIVGTIVIPDLAASPIDAFDFDDFAVLDGAVEGD